MRNHRKVI